MATALLALALAPGLGGCGGSGADAGDAASAGRSEPAALGRVSAPELRRQLANAFDAGLYRLAVMSQPPDDAKDLGQALPTGLISSVSCEQSAAGANTTHCSVRWQSVGGQRRRTRYLVHLLPGSCFAAGAQPRYPDHRDTTIETFSENPLNVLVSADPSCS